MKYVINVLNYKVNILNNENKINNTKKTKCFKKINSLSLLLSPIENAVKVLSIYGRVFVSSCL